MATVYAEDHAAVCVNDVKDEAAERGVPVVGETLHGVPHDVILKYAADVDADVIVVGEHGDHLDHFSGIRKRVADRSDRKVDVVKAEM
ncbi:universal stress protein [Natrinema gelatinilyticum]|uniref:universal stress protein n=1 Tax=Natrinema gelatinilyticum TaxID=2961571 RepID=UPI0020C4A05F|nr:universal stress protein [Natrinema gelatinilyticum]